MLARHVDRKAGAVTQIDIDLDLLPLQRLEARFRQASQRLELPIGRFDGKCRHKKGGGRGRRNYLSEEKHVETGTLP